MSKASVILGLDEGTDYQNLHSVRRDLTSISSKLAGLSRSKLSDVKKIASNGEKVVDKLRQEIFKLPEK